MSFTEPIRLLLVDHEESTQRMLAPVLAQHYAVLQAWSGEEALELAAAYVPALIILETQLPDMPGMALCRALRAWYAHPILVYTAGGSEADRIAALDDGADDYFVKSGSLGELLARLRALYRRSQTQRPTQAPIHAGELMLDLERHLVTRAGELVNLTPIEYEILACLMQHADAVLPTHQLILQVWGAATERNAQSLRTHSAICAIKSSLPRADRAGWSPCPASVSSSGAPDGATVPCSPGRRARPSVTRPSTT